MVVLAQSLLAQIRTHAAAAYPQECCGLLLGEGARITAAASTTNVHPTPRTNFEIDPAALIAAHRAARAGGQQIVGYYHSHPHGPAAPSPTDQAEAARDGRIWAIIGQSGAISLWRDADEGFVALPYSESND